MNEDMEVIAMVHQNHARSETNRRVGYIIYDHQADRIKAAMDAQQRVGDPVTLVMITLQVIVVAAVAVINLI